MDDYNEIADKLSLVKIVFLYNLFSVLVTLTFCENFTGLLRLRSMNTGSQVNFILFLLCGKLTKHSRTRM